MSKVEFRFLFTTFFVWLTFSDVMLAGDTIVYNPVSTENTIEINKFYVIENLGDTASAAFAYKQFANLKGQGHEGFVYNSGYTENVIWLAVNLINIDTSAVQLFLEVGDPHINNASLYKTADSSIILLGEMGDLQPFYSRPLSNSNFVFQFNLKSKEKSTLLLRIDNRGHTTMMPFSVTTFINHYKATVTSYILWGLLSGVLLFVCLFSLFTWISIKEKLFFYYALYAIVIAMWIWSNNGLGYQFLYPNSPHIMANIRLVAAAFGFALMLHVMQLFVKQAKENSRFYFFTNVVKIVLVVLGLIMFLPYDYSHDHTLISTFLIVSDLIVLGAVFLLFAGLIEKIKQGQKSAFTYLLAISVFFVTTVITVLIRLGVIAATTVALNSVYISTVVEILILAIALGQRYSALKKEEQRLQLELESGKRELVYKLELKAIEERNRIAADLHDEIGSGISGLRVFSEMAERKNTLEELKEDTLKITKAAASLAEKVREVVWTLDQENKNVEDFLLYIQKYGFLFFENSNIAFHMDIPLEMPYIFLSPDVQKHLLLTMKEIFNNALKHSGASKLVCETRIERELKILITDNGKGFNVVDLQAGNGLENIKNRIIAIGGRIQVESEIGVKYKINVPLTSAKL